jgi:hypothetical protein
MPTITTLTPQQVPVVARPPLRTWLFRVASALTVLALVASFFKLLTVVAIDEYVVAHRFAGTELAPVDAVAVSNTAGHVQVLAAPGAEVTVDLAVTDGLFRADRDARVDGQTLRVSASCTLWFTTHCRVDQVVAVPVALPVTVSARHGDVSLQGLRGPVSVDARFGPLRLDGLTGAAVVRHEFGELRAIQLGVADLELTHRFGDARLSFVQAPDQVRVEASFGTTVIEVPDDGGAYQVTGSSSFGTRGVEVRTDPNSDRTIHADTRFGDLVIRYAR